MLWGALGNGGMENGVFWRQQSVSKCSWQQLHWRICKDEGLRGLRWVGWGIKHTKGDQKLFNKRWRRLLLSERDSLPGGGKRKGDGCDMGQDMPPFLSCYPFVVRFCVLISFEFHYKRVTSNLWTLLRPLDFAFCQSILLEDFHSSILLFFIP